MDTDRLEQQLAAAIRGEVRFDKTSRILYSTDASLYQIMPVGVVFPRDAEDVAITVRLAAEAGVPVLPRGSGTSLGGQTVGAAVVLDFTRHMNRILELDTARREVRVQPGVILDDLNRFLRPYGLLFGPDVATSNRASIGGMIGNNSCGAHSIRYGKTVDHVLSLEVVLANGERARLEASSGPHPQISQIDADPTGSGMHREPEGISENAKNSPSSSLRQSAKSADEVGRLSAAIQRIVGENREEIGRRFPRIMRRVGGYNLDAFLGDGPHNLSHLIVGSEGTLATVTEATLKLEPRPRCTGLSILHFDDLITSLEATREILPFEPAAIELTDKYILDLTLGNLELAPARGFLVGDPQAILMVEFFGDTPEEVTERIEAMEGHLSSGVGGRGSGVGYDGLSPTPDPRPPTPDRPYAMVRALDAESQAQAWKVRKAGLGLLMGMKGEAKPVGFVEDTAVAPERLPEYIRRFQAILRAHDAEAVFYAHASVGCLHIRPILNLKRRDDVARMRAIAEQVSDLVLEFGGAMSAEHGDGLVRSEWNEKMFGPRIYRAFQEVKAVFDPQGIMNPGKIVNAPRMDENLRVGTTEATGGRGDRGDGGTGRRESPLPLLAPSPRRLGRPVPPSSVVGTYYDFSREGGLAAAVELCSGVGACRKRFDGTMCPSYRATLDEMHTTRARANMFRAVLNGFAPEGRRQKAEGSRDGASGLPSAFCLLPSEPAPSLTGPEMHAVMDLCLQCKACKAECPSNVDVAKLKSEFLAHSHAAHGTPLRAQIFGHVAASSRLASRAAPLANWALGLPLLKRALHRFAGIAPERDLPRYATTTFPEWFRRHRPAPAAGTRGAVALLNDTFMNYHEPEIGIAATRVLEACGYQVELTAIECCGRPQISKGLLPEAKATARRNITRLKQFVDRGMPILGCEPSCLVTFKDEYLDLAGGEDARAVAAACELVESFLARMVPLATEDTEFTERAAEVSGWIVGKLQVGMNLEPSHLQTFNSDAPSVPSVSSVAKPFQPRPGKALLHGHCHQKALLGTGGTLAALRLIPELQVAEIPSGCCGMAGSFGFEAEHYEVSMKIGEETLFPTIREASPDTLFLAPGTSCRQQIQHATGRVARHPIELLAEALLPENERQKAKGKGQKAKGGESGKRELALRLLLGSALAGAAVLVAARALGAGNAQRADTERG